MPPSDTAEIRIYCICGQKMKVAPSMLGRNGKCVACRQRIRIPRADELPGDGSPVYLKDQPQFLRSPVAGAAIEDASGQDAWEPEDLDLGMEEGAGVVALETLPALQRLCNLEHKVARHLAMLADGRGVPGAGHDKATLMRVRGVARQARAALDEELRQRLVEIRDQLDEAAAEITREHMAFRLAETTLATYQERVAALRQRRERLARRLQNVRGWLATRDPHAAGGHLEVTLEDVSAEAPEVTFSVEPLGDRPLAQEYLDRLRAALEERDTAERRLAELRRMGDEGAVEPGGGAEVIAEAEAAVVRARAAVAHYRTRLEQCQQDAEHDASAVSAHLKVLRERVSRRQLDQDAYARLESALQRARADAKQLRDLARRAVAATEAREVPDVRTTLIDRLSRPGGAEGVAPDAWVAFAASVAMIVNIVAPISAADLGGNRVITLEAAVGLFVAAVLTGLTAFIARRDARGLGYCALWTVGTLLAAFHVYDAWYSDGEVGRAMRQDPHWYRAPGIILLAISSATLFAAAAMALWHRRGRPRTLLACAGVVAASLVFLFTDAAGMWRPEAVMEPPVVREAGPGGTPVAVTLRNAGRRAYWLGGSAAMVPAPYHFAFEGAVDGGVAGGLVWEEIARAAPPPLTAEDRLDALVAPLQGDLRAVEPGGQVVISQTFPPGRYRARLAPRMRGLPEVVREFVVPEAETPAWPAPPGPRGADPDAGDAWDALPGAPDRPAAPPPPPPLPRVEITLRGVMNPADRPPMFVVSVQNASGVVEQRRVSLGDTVVGDWRAMEFNPDYKTLTLGNGDRVVVLESGKPVSAEVDFSQ